ncbi:MAG: hypothetical protein AABY01_05200 [Nanoarchaeota archaeon]
MKWGVSFIIAILFLLPVVSAATIHGTIYNIDLNPVKNARIDITTQPKQVFIATNGTYAFTVSEGMYDLSAALIQNGQTTASATESLTITDDGDYVLDLILFPDIEEGLLNEPDINPAEVIDESPVWPRVIIGILIVGALLWFFLKPKSKSQAHAIEHAQHKADHHTPVTEVKKEEIKEELQTEKDDVTPVIAFIKAQGGRTTQKDIRKQFPLSEAKISLIIAELEHKGAIEKIKKGRGNIIILK